MEREQREREKAETAEGGEGQGGSHCAEDTHQEDISQMEETLAKKTKN